MELRELKKSNIEYFKLNQFSSTVWFINHYNREDKTYSISKFEDVNAERFVKGTTEVFIDFDF